MNDTIKNRLTWVVVIALLIGAWSAYKYSRAYEESVGLNSQRSFSVQGDGKVTAVPDIAEFTATIISEGGKDLGALEKDSAEKSNKVVAFISSKGIEKKDIETRHYSVEPRYQTTTCYSKPVPYSSGVISSYAPGVPTRIPTVTQVCPPSEIVGYSIRQSTSVKIRKEKFNLIGELLSGVVTAGANSVSNISFTIDDPDSLQALARDKAIAKARKKAEATASAAGFSIGRVISVDENYGGYYPYAKYGAMSAMMSSAPESAPAPTIEPGSQEVTANVTIRYEIQ